MKPSIKWSDSLSDEKKEHTIIIITTIMTVLIALSTTTRIGVKLRQGMKMQYEDLIIILDFVSISITYIGPSIHATQAINLTGHAFEYEAV